MILIAPLLATAPKMLPGFARSSKLTRNTFDPEHTKVFPMPPPITATYLSPSIFASPSFAGILNILGVDQVSPSWL